VITARLNRADPVHAGLRRPAGVETLSVRWPQPCSRGLVFKVVHPSGQRPGTTRVRYRRPGVRVRTTVHRVRQGRYGGRRRAVRMADGYGASPRTGALGRPVHSRRRTRRGLCGLQAPDPPPPAWPRGTGQAALLRATPPQPSPQEPSPPELPFAACLSRAPRGVARTVPRGLSWR
jgi:hypothetical protein